MFFAFFSVKLRVLRGFSSYFQRLDGCLRGCDLSIDEARTERLSRQ